MRRLIFKLPSSLRKLRVSWLWILFLVLMWYTQNLKTMFFIFSMLSIHELSHIVIGHLFHYEVEKVILYPFGLCAQMRYIGYGTIWKELLIIAAGPAVQFCFPLIFELLMKGNLISSSYADYLNMLNASILIFNLLPVYPLDGGRLLQSLYHLVLSYKKAQLATFITSLVNLFLLFHYRFLNGISGYLVLIFLGMQIIMGMRELTFSQLAFYHYRYQHPAKGKEKWNSGNDLYRARYNIMKTKNSWLEEQDWLKLYFGTRKSPDKKSNIMI